MFGELADTSRHLLREMENASRVLVSRRPNLAPASPAASYLDLLALRREFGDVQIDDKKHELAVTTDSIELECVELGDFAIRLEWMQIGLATQPYRVVALDPHPAARRDNVTHPHVQDGRVCEGEGRSAIAAALAELRLYDFFMLVNQILHTYGRGAAYVEMEAWESVPCSDCGTGLGNGDRYYCNACDSTLCDSCSPSCHGCQNTYCSGCLHECAACGCDYCSSCLKVCPMCRKRFCADCREDRLCLTCYQETHKEKTEDDSSDDSHGKALCPAGQDAIEAVS